MTKSIEKNIEETKSEPTRVPLVVGLSGDGKSGKTHLAFTFPSPIADFELDIKGSLPVRPKFPDKQIDVFSFPLPIIDSDPPEPYAFKLLKEIKAKYAEVTSSGKYKTVIIDTTSMLWRIVGHAQAELLDQKKIIRVQYYVPNLIMNSFYTRAKLAGMNLVAINYLKDEFVKNEATGEKETDGWGQSDTAVDVVIWLKRNVEIKSKRETKVSWDATFKASRYEPDPPVDGMVLTNTNYEEIYAMLGLP